MECDKAPANRRIIKTAKCKMGNSVIFDRFIKNFLADSDSTLSLIDVVKIKQTIDALEKNQYRILRNLQGIDLPNYYTMFIGYQLNNVKSLIDNPLEYKKMAQTKNPYGDGLSSKKIYEYLKSELSF